jgi:hypothetical protein
MPEVPEIQHPIEGKVAQVLNERELVINIGHDHGAVLGMKFAVLSDKPIEILDPDTHDLTRTVGNFPLLSASALAGLTFQQKVVEDLRSDSRDRPKPLTPEESYVKIGDRVQEIFEPAK